MLRGFFFFEADLEDSAEVYADPGLLEVVWTNLLSNAVKFTPEGGTVTLHQRTEPGRVLVSVEDTGCGMTPETMRHIYDKFYQGDSSHATHGNGLGLALVRRFLEKTDDAPENRAITRTTLIFSLEKLQEKLRAEHMTPTVFFTALLAQTAMELQRRKVTPDRPLQPVQIMVPVDLRRRFSSALMRNFSPYALPSGPGSRSAAGTVPASPCPIWDRPNSRSRSHGRSQGWISC